MFYGDAAQSIARSQIQTFLNLDKSEPGAWALAQGENSLLLIDNAFQQGNGAIIELHKAIPIPERDVPLAEILEFKHRRKDELLNLRNHLDSFSYALDKSENLSDDLKIKISGIDDACANLLQLGKEWQFPVHISNLKASFTVSTRNVIPSAASGWYVGQQFNLSAAAAVAVVSGALSAIEIKGDFGYRSRKKERSPYRYAYHAHQELL